MSKQIYNILGFISEASLYGIKLDIIAHLIIGFLIFIIARRYTGLLQSLLIVSILALFKEIHDMQIMTNTIQENIKDFIVSLIIPAFLILKSKYESSRAQESHQ